MEHVEVLRDLSEVCRAAIKAGDWKVDGACDPDAALRRADAAIASLSAPQPPAEAHCTTCSCVPGMTPAVRFDATPAEKEGAVREHLISMGWTPPEEAAPAGEVGFKAWLVEQMPTGTVIGNPEWWAERIARAYELNIPQPTPPTQGKDAEVLLNRVESAPVGVEDLSCCGGNDETPKSHCMDCPRYPGQLAQQPAAVDGWRLMVHQSERDTKPAVWATDGDSFVWVADLAAQQGDSHD